MKILAIEFSSARRSVAVVENGARVPLGTATQADNEKTKPLTLVEQALRTARMEREQIECIAVGLGPGSYTGIRMAISLAQGWQLARNVRVLGVGSVECLAAQAQAEGISGRVNIVIDAQRNEFYLATYELGSNAPRVVEPLRLTTLAEVRARVTAGEVFLGPEADKWFPTARVVFPDAAMLGVLAGSRTEFLPGEKLEPIYLRETSFVKAPPPRVIV